MRFKLKLSSLRKRTLEYVKSTLFNKVSFIDLITVDNIKKMNGDLFEIPFHVVLDNKGCYRKYYIICVEIDSSGTLRFEGYDNFDQDYKWFEEDDLNTDVLIQVIDQLFN